MECINLFNYFHYLLGLLKYVLYLYIIIKNKHLEIMKTTSIHIEKVERETEKAILVKVENKKAAGCYTDSTFWLPKSQISSANFDTIKVGFEDEIVLPFWLARKLCDEGHISRIDF